MKGDHFRIFKEADGHWHWELHKSHSPYAPMARSRKQGYRSEGAARSSIKSHVPGGHWSVAERRATYRGEAHAFDEAGRLTLRRAHYADMDRKNEDDRLTFDTIQPTQGRCGIRVGTAPYSRYRLKKGGLRAASLGIFSYAERGITTSPKAGTNRAERADGRDLLPDGRCRGNQCDQGRSCSHSNQSQHFAANLSS